MSLQRVRQRSEPEDDGPPVAFSIPSTHDAVDHLATRVWEVLDHLPMPALTRSELEMALLEALDNASEHGNRSDPTKHVKVICCARPDQVKLTIEDEGEGFDAAALADPTVAENLLKEGGRGIFLMRRLTDACRFEKGGRRVILVKRIPPIS
jgi:serine/threonine-protein kinase RsbW